MKTMPLKSRGNGARPGPERELCWRLGYFQLNADRLCTTGDTMCPVVRKPLLFRRRMTWVAAVALSLLLTVAVTVILAHEGHAPLPTKGVQVDIARGHLLLTPAARNSLAVSTAEVEVTPVEGKLLAYATVELPWTYHGFATARLPGRIVKVNIAPGQTVRAGDVVAEVQSLDLDTLQLEVLTARTDVALGEK